MAVQIKLTTEASNAWNEFKLNKLQEGDAVCTWIAFAFDDANEPQNIVVSKKGTGDYDEFVAALPENECGYAVWNLRKGKNQKLALLLWAPENSPVKSRMIVASNRGVRAQLDGVGISFQADRKSECVLSEWEEKAKM